MLFRKSLAWAALAGVAVLAGSARAEGLKRGTPEMQSAGPLAFGPDGILFVGDPQAATLFALDTGDRTAGGAERPNVQGIDEKIAALLGIEAKQLQIVDLAVNPISGNTYVSVARGKGPDAKPVLLRVDRVGKIAEFPLKDVKFASMALSKAAEGKKRQDAITHLAYSKGT